MNRQPAAQSKAIRIAAAAVLLTSLTVTANFGLADHCSSQAQLASATVTVAALAQ